MTELRFISLCDQSTDTANDYMLKAIEKNDRTFGDGYAKQNQSLVADFMQTSAKK
jgi:hypothetical protein